MAPISNQHFRTRIAVRRRLAMEAMAEEGAVHLRRPGPWVNSMMSSNQEGLEPPLLRVKERDRLPFYKASVILLK